MRLLTRFKFFFLGVFLGSILVFFFFGEKIKDWGFYYFSEGRIINHLIEPRYTIIHYNDTIGNNLSLQGVFSILQNEKFGIDISIDLINQLDEPIKYIQENVNQIQDSVLIINKKNVFYTDQVLKKLNLKELSDSLSFNIIDSLIKESEIGIIERGDCYKYSLKNKYSFQEIEFVVESCDTIVELITFKVKN